MSIPLILLILGLVAARCLWVLVFPHGPCWRCGGAGVIRPAAGRRKRCPVCRGRKRRQRLGSRAVHRFFWLAVGTWWMERRRERQHDNTNDERRP